MFRIKNKMNDLGVSPVIGVILMVAVTVILAAVIGSFVLGLGSNVEQNPQAGVTFNEDSESNEVNVQIISLENADSLELQVNGGTNATVDTPFTNYQVGETATVTDDDGASGTITVVGTLDGTDSVIQTYEYDFS